MITILFLPISLIFFILMFSHIYLTNQFFVQLKKMHVHVWDTLGQPQWRIHFGDDSFTNAMKYIRKKEFTSLNDTVLESIYKKLKNVERGAVGLALIIIVATILDVFVKG
ncbi:hypothetical protein JHD50_03300 [Sulfurimonas sp. MAG313]|nr:hypothetical protein [Sulfurimonas sp. MAG313]MDF1880339.1 hypothetical protein [Sulfurimonas sp. MAG313]